MINFQLEGNTALVVGASRGIGARIAKDLYDLGATVIGTSRNQDSANRIAAKYSSLPVTLDIADPADIRTVIDGLVAQAIIPDLLVINAGINQTQDATEVDIAAWDEIFATNVRGAFFIAQALAREWIKHGIKGRVVFIGSQTGRVAIPGRVTYGASKAAIEQMTRSLAVEWGPYGIQVNCVAPTFVHTAMTEKTLSGEDFRNKMRAQIPLGRFGELPDVSGPVVFLLGEAAGLVTGHTLVVDGGYTAH